MNHMADIVDNCPFTVFAPTDDAFTQLAAATVDAFLQDIPKLTKILKTVNNNENQHFSIWKVINKKS